MRGVGRRVEWLAVGQRLKALRRRVLQQDVDFVDWDYLLLTALSQPRLDEVQFNYLWVYFINIDVIMHSIVHRGSMIAWILKYLNPDILQIHFFNFPAEIPQIHFNPL